MIHELCEFVLQHSQRPELIQKTLQTLHAFLSWIPLGYIFESTLLAGAYTRSLLSSTLGTLLWDRGCA
jgi:hypothetical protein